MKKALLFTLFLFLPGISAFLSSCGCDQITHYCHYIKQMDVTMFDNSGKEAVPAGAAVIAKALMLKLVIDEKVDVCLNRKQRYNPFASPVYAFKKADCQEDFYKDSVVSLQVTSNHNYSAGYEAGKNLLPLFSPIVIKDLKTKADRNLYLLESPADTGTHVFTVSVILADGDTMRNVLSPVKLLK